MGIARHLRSVQSMFMLSAVCQLCNTFLPFSRALCAHRDHALSKLQFFIPFQATAKTLMETNRA